MNGWIVAAMFGASLTGGAGLGLATAVLMHRYRTRQLNRRWASIARALRQEDPS